MEQNVMKLLEAEKAVNAKVKAAQEDKNNLIRSIKREADIAVAVHSRLMEKQYQIDLAKVSI